MGYTAEIQDTTIFSLMRWVDYEDVERKTESKLEHTGCRLAFSSLRLTVRSSFAMVGNFATSNALGSSWFIASSSSEESSSSVENPCRSTSDSEASASASSACDGSGSGEGDGALGVDFFDFLLVSGCFAESFFDFLAGAGEEGMGSGAATGGGVGAFGAFDFFAFLLLFSWGIDDSAASATSASVTLTVASDFLLFFAFTLGSSTTGSSSLAFRFLDDTSTCSTESFFACTSALAAGSFDDVVDFRSGFDFFSVFLECVLTEDSEAMAAKQRDLLQRLGETFFECFCSRGCR